MTITTTRNDLDAIARQPFHAGHIVGTTDDGCPIVADDAPDLCENQDHHLPALQGHQRVEIWENSGALFCLSTAGWAARQGAALKRVGVGTFQKVAV